MPAGPSARYERLSPKVRKLLSQVGRRVELASAVSAEPEPEKRGKRKKLKY